MLKKSIAIMALCSATAVYAQNLSSEQRAWYASRLGVSGAGPVGSVPQADRLGEALLQWKRLQQSDNLPFNDYASFLVTHPDWPGETRMRRIAENQIPSTGSSPASLVAFFDRHPPVTASGGLRYAEALQALGREAEAREQARAAWRRGAFNSTSASADEAAMLQRFGTALTAEDHDARFDMLLWQDDTSDAARVLSLTSPSRRDAQGARLRLATGAGAEAGGDAILDAGYVAERAMWLRNNGRSSEARSLLANRPPLRYRPGDAEEWYEVLLTNARAAENDGQLSTAFDIASRVDDAFPAGTDISEQALGVRDDYTSLVWLAGTTALWHQNRPAEAIGMFERYARAARTPQTRSKGFYWAGRAAQAAGRRDEANRFYEEAAAYYDYFYGQLAYERLGRQLAVPGTQAERPTAEQANAFNEREIVRAARMLGQLGAWEDQSTFLREIAEQMETEGEHQLAGQLASQIGRQDLAVMAHRSARVNGFDASNYGYPVVNMPSGTERFFTIVHAIARQESQFDPRAVSHAGARGLMQFMPATAREVSGWIGRTYSPSNLTNDPQYSIQLGRAYYESLLNRWGNHVLAIASYNAGPGNVNRWIRANGDPRTAGVDIVQWIEEIPIYETKNYVQRVVENAVMYDLLHPDRAFMPRSNMPASRWLGKGTPG
ncbi:lytic transglycosylase domain-containing protein [uncultured Parasphingopyxis sp.]|uniref:lytic transglycosylase domain-containing protein n=1 Tax=uncultured Parasphingopyxis sp. TaxID=1547918 RepID=UPI00261F1535|nr:lytic transglycosylase domain-containing protein [uncultured Parasphingopyxis sp.]